MAWRPAPTPWYAARRSLPPSGLAVLERCPAVRIVRPLKVYNWVRPGRGDGGMVRQNPPHREFSLLEARRFTLATHLAMKLTRLQSPPCYRGQKRVHPVKGVLSMHLGFHN